MGYIVGCRLKGKAATVRADYGLVICLLQVGLAQLSCLLSVLYLSQQ